MTALLDVRGLAVRPPGADPLVEGVDVTVHAGEIIALLGPSGAGKTTLLRALLDPAVLTDAGYDVRFAKRDLNATPAFVPQGGALLDHLDVAGNIALAQAGGGTSGDPATWLMSMGLDPSLVKERRPVSALSGGQAQRVAVARTLAAGRNLVVLDEPSVGLDPLGVRALARLLRQQAAEQHIGVLLITHDLVLAGGAARRILFLDPAGRRVVDVDPSWPGPVTGADPAERTRRLAALEARVEQLIAGAQAAPPRAVRRRQPLGLFTPIWAMGAAFLHALTPRLFWASARVFFRLFWSAYVRPFAFFVTVGALLGFTVPFVISNVSAGLDPRAVLGVVGGTYILSLSPPISAIVFAATSGSAVNAWLGGLRLRGQVAALGGLGIRPERYLYSPAWFALSLAYLGTAAAFVGSMVVGGWVLFSLHAVPSPLWKLLSNFIDPAPGQLAPVVRMLALFLAYAAAIPSIAVAKGSEAKAASDDVTAAMTSAVVRTTLFVVVLELAATAIQQAVKA